MSNDLTPGDAVEWNTPQGPTTGHIERKVTHMVRVGGAELKGTSREPVYVVRSDTSGKLAGHKGTALRRRSH